MHVFLGRVAKRKSFFSLRKLDSTMLSQQFRKFAEQTKETHAVESVFDVVVVDGLGSSNFLQGTLRKTFLDNFPKIL